MAGQPGPRTKVNTPHQPCIVTPSTQSVAFGRRRDAEFGYLKARLAQQLQGDFTRIFVNNLHCDLELEGNTKSVHTHRSVLKSRVANFYSQHCEGQLREDKKGHWCVRLPVGVSEDVIEDFVRNIYTTEEVSIEEQRVLEYFQQCIIVSPDFDAYKTPQCSPSDTNKDYGFCEEGSEDLRASLQKSSVQYYSLVPLDEVCSDSLRSTDLLDRELEEQDELFRSFQSIRHNSTVKKPSHLQLSSRQTKNNFLCKPKPQQHTCLILEEEPYYETKHIEPVYTEEAEDLLLSCISSPCSPFTPDMEARTLDSGVESGPATDDHTVSISHPSSSSPLLPRDPTVSETSGLSTLDDGKHNCTSMASISDGESDQEFPDEPADTNVVVEHGTVQVDNILLQDTTKSQNSMHRKTTVTTEHMIQQREEEKITPHFNVEFHADNAHKNVLEVMNFTPESNPDTQNHQCDLTKPFSLKNTKESLNENVKQEKSCNTQDSLTKQLQSQPHETFKQDEIIKEIKNDQHLKTDEEPLDISQSNITALCNNINFEECSKAEGELLNQSTKEQNIVKEVSVENNCAALNPPFCLVTSIEQDFTEEDCLPENSIDKPIDPAPQFVTYDVNRSSNVSSGNFFIDASSLLDESELSSGDWILNSKEEKITITGVTTSYTDDHEEGNLPTKQFDIKGENPDSLDNKEKDTAFACDYTEKKEPPKNIQDVINSTPKNPEQPNVVDDVKLEDNSPSDTKAKEHLANFVQGCFNETIKSESSSSTSPENMFEKKGINLLNTANFARSQEEENLTLSSASELKSKETYNDSIETTVVKQHLPETECPASSLVSESIVSVVGSYDSQNMTQSAPASVDIKTLEERPKSLDCSQLFQYQETVEPRQKPTLVRRNTFEMEADDKNLTTVRKEYEKKQGELLFKSCIPAFSQHVTGTEGQQSGNKLPMTPLANEPQVQPESCYPNTEYQESFILQQHPHLVPLTDDDVHSPDSLNNDGPLDAFCQQEILSVNVLEIEPPKNEIKVMDTPRKQKYDESMPIVSGGVSCEDYQIEIRDSPQVRRRTESTPILSGANMTSMETPTSSPRLPRKHDATAWVVDMSDPQDIKSPESRRKRRNILPSQLQTVSADEETDIPVRKNSGLGFFVDLSDSEKPKSPTYEQQVVEPTEKKKSFFSMYIDLSDGKPSNGNGAKKIEKRAFSREISKEETVEEHTKPTIESNKDMEVPPKEKQGFFMFIEAEPPLVRRQTMSGSKPNINRHSWNAEPKPNEETKRHKRAQSLCVDQIFQAEDTHKSGTLSKQRGQSTQSLDEESKKPECLIETEPKPRMMDYLERSEMRVMTRSMDETLTTEVKVRTGRAELEPVLERSEGRRQFVRLSDMDGRGNSRHESRQPGDGRARTRKVEETSWIESKLMVRGSRGLTRSKSPGSISTSLVSCHSPSQDTDESELSSMQSSVDRSGLDASTEETDLSSSYPGRGPCSRLGEDLLRMFLEEINTDVTVEVSGRRIRAHKCILSSRCQYFAAMLSGGWVESAGNVIALQGFSYQAVHFALSHIYSGTSNIPDSLSIVELATLTDMLGLEGLKEVIMYTLKVKYCHFFHKPCSMCAVGVLECLPLAAAYGLDEIYHKSLKWTTKYFVRIWPSKAFANLPRELVDKCYLQHVVHMSVDNVLDTVMSCDRLLATLPSVRWAETVFALTSQLLEACVGFMSEHFSGVLTSDRFVSLGKELSWNISRLEDSIMAAVDGVPPEQACQSYTKLTRILAVANSSEPPPEMQWSASFVELLQRIKGRIEVGLMRQASRAMRCKSWSMLDSTMRSKVQEAACIGTESEDGRRARSLSLTKRNTKSRSNQSNNAYGTTPRYSGGRLVGAPPTLDLRQVTLAMARGERVASTQSRAVPMPPRRAPEGCTHPDKISGPKSRQARPRTATETKQSSTSDASGRPKTWPMKVLEQNKACGTQKPASGSSSTTASRTATPEKSAVPPRMVRASSSESSRTSSPALRSKNNRKATVPRKPIEPMKSASSSHIPVASSKPFLSPVLRGARETQDSPTSKSVTELTRTKNSPIPALKSRAMSRSSQASLADRRPSSGSIRLTKSSTVDMPSKLTNQNSQNSPLRKNPVSNKIIDTSKPPFRLGTSTESLRKSALLSDKPKSTPLKRTTTVKGQENIRQSPKTEKNSMMGRRLAEQGNDRKDVVQKGQRKLVSQCAPIPLSQSSSAPAINKGFIAPKLLSATSRSGTFLKDEPTILKKPTI